MKYSGSPGTPEEEEEPSHPFPKAGMPMEGSCGAVPEQGVLPAAWGVLQALTAPALFPSPSPRELLSSPAHLSCKDFSI